MVVSEDADFITFEFFIFDVLLIYTSIYVHMTQKLKEREGVLLCFPHPCLVCSGILLLWNRKGD